LAWLVATALLRHAAAADEPVRTVVVMVPEASPPLPVQQLTAALTSQLAELGVEVQLSTGPAPASLANDATASAPRDVLAFVWIEGTGDALVVHFYEPAGASLRERRIPVADTGAASLEEVAVVVRSAASALLERGQPAEPQSPPPPPPESAPAPPPPPPPPEASTAAPLFQLALGYVGELYAPGIAWQSGAMSALAWRPGRRGWVVGAGYVWFPPVSYRTQELTLEIVRHPAELLVGWENPIAGPRVSFRAEGALVVDPIARHTSRASEPLRPAPDDTRWSWSASMRLRVAWAPAARWWLFGSGGADLVLNPFSYVVDDQDESTVVSPLSVRPRGQVGLAVDIR